VKGDETRPRSGAPREAFAAVALSRQVAQHGEDSAVLVACLGQREHLVDLGDVFDGPTSR
jgi:hypothetical protein